MPWVGQPAAPGALRAELTWQARPGTAGAIASALAGWNRLRFEVTEDGSPGCDGVRHCYTPDLGIFTAVTGATGDIMVPEDRLQAALMGMACHRHQRVASRTELGRLLGTAWDNELEPFRRAADGAPVRWLNANRLRPGLKAVLSTVGGRPPAWASIASVMAADRPFARADRVAAAATAAAIGSCRARLVLGTAVPQPQSGAESVATQ